MQIASHALGAAIRAAEVANDYATHRHQFGRAIREAGDHPTVVAGDTAEITRSTDRWGRPAR